MSVLPPGRAIVSFSLSLREHFSAEVCELPVDLRVVVIHKES